TWRGATMIGARSITPPITGSIARASTFPAWRSVNSGRVFFGEPGATSPENAMLGEGAMAWQFERVAGPYQGPLGGVVRDGDGVIFSAIDAGLLLRFAPKTKAATEVRRYTNRVNGLGRGPNGELYGAQEGGRRLVEFTPDGRVMPVDARLDGAHHNQPSDLVVDRAHRIYFT